MKLDGQGKLRIYQGKLGGIFDFHERLRAIVLYKSFKNKRGGLFKYVSAALIEMGLSAKLGGYSNVWG